jgi:hypothetical protein
LITIILTWNHEDATFAEHCFVQVDSPTLTFAYKTIDIINERRLGCINCAALLQKNSATHRDDYECHQIESQAFQQAELTMQIDDNSSCLHDPSYI